MGNDNKLNGLTDDDRAKLKELLGYLKTDMSGREEADFLCTHCHCKVCASTGPEMDQPQKAD
ncbi:MAG: hypothetical protein HY751_01175 [Nitrospinae bacterium]|nr:hypothetical protein [Nitrospinota bacterium]